MKLHLALANPSGAGATSTTATTLYYNVPYDELTRPAQGPSNPFKPAGGQTLKRKNVLTGYAEEAALSEATFTVQHRTFQSLGYARDPSVLGGGSNGSSGSGSASPFVGDVAAAARFGGRDVVQLRPSKADSAALRRKRQKRGDAGIVDGEGAYRGPWARYDDDDAALAAEAARAGAGLASDEEYEEDALEAANIDLTSGDGAGVNRFANMPGAAYARDDADGGATETSEFHGAAQFDYQGRTYMHVPQDLGIDLRKEVGSIKNYVPKKLIHTWKLPSGGAGGALAAAVAGVGPYAGGAAGGSSGVGGVSTASAGGGKAITALRFFPHSGHLLLSAAADAKVRIWDVYHERALLRTFSGHARAVTDACFSRDGTRFLSASFDRSMKLWDTEYGRCVARFSTGKIPHVVRFQGDAALAHEFLAGMSDKKIVQFDTRIDGSGSEPDGSSSKGGGGGSGGGGGGGRGWGGKPVQEYDHHLGAINTITFVDEHRRFITTSDDKSLRAWEYGIPVPIKFIAEPHMYAMVRAAPHPAGKYVAFQSADNQIVVYAATDKFRQNRKKCFRGHHTAGHAIDVSISPDGQFVASGDSAGFVCFWDFKTCKMLHKIPVGKGVGKAAAAAEAGGGSGSGAGGRDAVGVPVVAAQWHPQETSKFVTGSLDGVIRYFD